MKKTLIGILAIISLVMYSCTPAQRIEGTYNGDLIIHDITGTMLASIHITKVDDYHASFDISSSGFSDNVNAVTLEVVDSRLELHYSDIPSEGNINILSGNLSNDILYLNFSVTIGGVERNGNLQNGRKQ